jgi:hypothetical protein
MIADLLKENKWFRYRSAAIIIEGGCVLFARSESIQKTKEIIFSFPKLMESLTYQEKSELLRKVIEKVFVVRNKDGDDEVHIFVKGTSENEYDYFFEKESERSELFLRGLDGIS